MSKVRVIDVHTGIFDENNRIADEIRRQNGITFPGVELIGE